MKVKGDGNCLLRNLSYGLYENEKYHRGKHLIIANYVKDIWDDVSVRLNFRWLQEYTFKSNKNRASQIAKKKIKLKNCR